ncbi:MAG: hypothetical protein KBH12_07660 [Synergistaceae bacterium]|nr:hypothetical protein [Synergistaceae bacterium]MBP9626973.1 hypothetical protein [Synergistaceae bacterium]
MNSVYAFTVIMLIWVISDYVSKKTKSFISSLLVASVIFLIGFKTNGFFVELTKDTIFASIGNTFSRELLPRSSLLGLGQTVVGFIIIHLGTMISLEELKKQIKTFFIGASSVIGVAAFLFVIGPFLKDMNYVIAGIAALTGATVSIIIVQERALELGLLSVAAFPVLIAAFQGLVGFPLTSILLRKEAVRLQAEYRSGKLTAKKEVEDSVKKKFDLLPFMSSTSGTLFAVGVVLLIAQKISAVLPGGFVHPFIIALLFGVVLREIGLFKPNVLSGIDAFGLMMLAILIIVFGPLASISPNALFALIWPIFVTFSVGLAGNIAFSVLAGKLVGYSAAMSVAVGLTSLYGFPGTMILSQEAARSVGETEEEKAVIEGEILPKMIIAGFSTVTITSVIITGIIVSFLRV